MFNDDDENEEEFDDFEFKFLGGADIPPEQREELEEFIRGRVEQMHAHPLAKKSREIITIVSALLDSMGDDEDDADSEEYDFDEIDFESMSDEEEAEMLMDTLHNHVRSEMMENAYLLGAKFAGAEANTSYVLKMENAVLIKIAARAIGTHATMLEHQFGADHDHIKLLKEELEAFKQLFVEWVSKITPNDDEEPDGWGLFL